MIALPIDWSLVLLLTMAAAANLPLTLLLPLIVGALPWFTPAHPGLSLLASPGPAIAGGLLLTTSLLLRRIPGLRELWQAFLGLATVPAAALLAHLLLAQDRSLEEQILASLAAVLLAIPIVGIRFGSEALRRWTAERSAPRPPLRWSLAPGGAAVLLILTAMAEWSVLALPVLLLVLVWIARMRSELRACSFLRRLATEAGQHLYGAKGWRQAEALPNWVRERSESTGGLRGVRSGLLSPDEHSGFRSGWLVDDPRGLRFVYRTPLQLWELDFASAELGAPRSGASSLRLPLTLDGSEHLLILPRHAPDPRDDMRVGDPILPNSSAL